MNKQYEFQQKLIKNMEAKSKQMLDRLIKANPDMPLKFSHDMADIITKEAKKTIVRVFEMLSDQELDTYEKYTAMMEAPELLAIETKVQPLMNSFMQNITDKLVDCLRIGLDAGEFDLDNELE